MGKKSVSIKLPNNESSALILGLIPATIQLLVITLIIFGVEKSETLTTIVKAIVLNAPYVYAALSALGLILAIEAIKKKRKGFNNKVALFAIALNLILFLTYLINLIFIFIILPAAQP